MLKTLQLKHKTIQKRNTHTRAGQSSMVCFSALFARCVSTCFQFSRIVKVWVKPELGRIKRSSSPLGNYRNFCLRTVVKKPDNVNGKLYWKYACFRFLAAFECNTKETVVGEQRKLMNSQWLDIPLLWFLGEKLKKQLLKQLKQKRCSN